MADIVTLTHRNVCKDGFTVEDTVDAGMIYLLSLRLIASAVISSTVFLDLPAPWDAIEHAKKALKVCSHTHY